MNHKHLSHVTCHYVPTGISATAQHTAHCFNRENTFRKEQGTSIMDRFLKRKAPQEPDLIDCEMEPTTSCEPSSTSSESAPKVAKVDKAKNLR